MRAGRSERGVLEKKVATLSLVVRVESLGGGEEGSLGSKRRFTVAIVVTGGQEEKADELFFGEEVERRGGRRRDLGWEDSMIKQPSFPPLNMPRLISFSLRGR